MTWLRLCIFSCNATRYCRYENLSWASLPVVVHTEPWIEQAVTAIGHLHFFVEEETDLFNSQLLTNNTYNTFINTGANNFNINNNTNTKSFLIQYQYRYQYLRSLNSITIPISIPKFSKFNIKLNTIPKYLDTLRSQDNIIKTRASIAHLWYWVLLRLFMNIGIGIGYC